MPRRVVQLFSICLRPTDRGTILVGTRQKKERFNVIIIFIIIFLNASAFVSGGSGTTIRHNTQNNIHHTK
jgi:hypothetical protein